MLTLVFAALAFVGATSSTSRDSPASKSSCASCAGSTYTYRELAGYGFVPGNARDKHGDTLGSLGSAAAFEPGSWAWSRASNSYTGILWAQPDRGWNTNGTLNHNPRIHKFAVEFAPNASASPQDPAPPKLRLEYLDTILFCAPDGSPLTGLDADAQGHMSFPGFPDLPVTTYTGDGFGGSGTGGKRVPVDAEGLVVNGDGSFWVSDEYGPYMYKLSPQGCMVQAIRPPDAYIPIRNDSESFSAAASPPIYDASRAPVPTDPSSGRSSNNQGFEGLTISPSGTTFLVLSRDSGAGRAQPVSRSAYRQIDVFDTRHATDLRALPDAEQLDAVDGAIASADKGKLSKEVAAATYCAWLDFKVDAQMARWGLRNGGADDAALLNEKWESMALVPVLEPEAEAEAGVTRDAGGSGQEYYILSISDNDFITQDGRMDGGALRYRDASGKDLDNQALVFRVRLPVWGASIVR